LGWYILLVAASMLVSIVGIRQTLLARPYERIEQSLKQEVLELRRLETGLGPRTSQPFGSDIEALFRVFLSRNVPADNEFLLTFLDGEFASSSLRAVPPSLVIPVDPL
jgi:hypothetical protein